MELEQELFAEKAELTGLMTRLAELESSIETQTQRTQQTQTQTQLKTQTQTQTQTWA